MIRNLKALGLALIAVFAMSALMASAAQAQGKFTVEAGTQELTGTQDDEEGQNTATGLQVFETTSGKVQCDEVHGQVLSGKFNETEVTAQNIHYQNNGKVDQCSGPFSTSPKIEFNGCDYTFTVGETIGETGMETTSNQVHIKCPVGKQITITAPFCQIHVPEQTIQMTAAGDHVVFHTITGTPDDVTVDAHVTGIHYQGTELCSSGTAGVYDGNVTVKGYKSTTHDSQQQTNIEVH